MNKHYPYRPDMPVSAKYYARLCERVRTILNDCLFSEQACANRERRILYLINRYMCPKAGLVCPQGDDPICNIIFQTLRAEIDAAMERSRSARARAAARRAQREAEAAQKADLSATPVLAELPVEGAGVKGLETVSVGGLRDLPTRYGRRTLT